MICVGEDIAHSRQRVLVISQGDALDQIKGELNDALGKKEEGETIETVKAFSMFPGQGGVAYIVKKFRLGKTEMDRAFSKAFAGLESVSLPDSFPLE